MWNWLVKQLKLTLFLATPDAEEDAKKYLNDLRENELSVGAMLRRGESINKAPGQVYSETQVFSIVNTKPEIPMPLKQETSNSDDESLGDSIVIGALSGSAMVGFVLGGSLPGGLIGASLSSNASTSNNIAISED